MSGSLCGKVIVSMDLGLQVLQHVVKTWPRSKEARAARTKLKQVK